MASKRFGLILGLVVAASSVGCQGTFVSKEQYDRDTRQQREYISALERDNALMRPKADAYDKLRSEADLHSAANSTYAELAGALKNALAGLGVTEKEIEVDTRTGRVSFATDILFDLGSWTLTARGRDLIAKFAQAQKGHAFKVIGHTDRRRIARPKTKEALATDTNKELSVLRAVAVMGELLKNGVRETQIDSVVGMGFAQPRETESKSRRVEIFLVEPAADAPAKTSFKR